ncbi:hypothetical protein HK096_010211, partial [Nowakowskiella sp. JEL0078]
MVADQVVGLCRMSLKRLNLYTAHEIVDECNKIKSVNAEFLNHNDKNRPFFTNWDSILSKYFKKMPTGYTANYFFKFSEGTVVMRHLTSSPETKAETINLVKLPSIESVCLALLKELFATDNIDNMQLSSITLPRHLGNPIPEK